MTIYLHFSGPSPKEITTKLCLNMGIYMTLAQSSLLQVFSPPPQPVWESIKCTMKKTFVKDVRQSTPQNVFSCA